MATDLIALAQQSQLAQDEACFAKGKEAEAKLVSLHDQMMYAWRVDAKLYNREDVAKLHAQTIVVLNESARVLQKGIDANDWGKADMASQLANVQKQADKGAVFVQALNEGTRVIDAPGLRHWVLACMDEAGRAYFVLGVSKCKAPWYWSALQAVVSAGEFLLRIVKSIGKVVVWVGELIAKAPDAAAALIKFIKWGAILGGAGFAYWKYTEHKARLKS